jgi:hypothetical protein
LEQHRRRVRAHEVLQAALGAERACTDALVLELALELAGTGRGAGAGGE